MTRLHRPIREGMLPLGLLGLAAIGLAGCDRHAASQTPATPVATTLSTSGGEPRDKTGDVAPAEALAASATATIEQATHTAPVNPEPAAESPAAAAPPSKDGPPRPASLRPKADRTAARNGVEKITFDDLILGMQADMVYRPWMLESEANGGRAKELDGKRVRLPGVMHGGVESVKKNKEFVLLRNKECKFGRGGQADHLAKIFMKDGKTASYTDETLNVEGTLRIKATRGEDGNTWSIYEIEDAELK